VTGVALMRMDEGLDTGPLVAVEEIPLQGTEVAPSLEALLAERGADLLVRSLSAWLAGELAAQPQAAEGATLTRPLRREDGGLDPTRPVAELERQVRALQPWPGAWVETDHGRIAVQRARVWPDPPVGRPGRLRALGSGLVLAAADGSLELLTVQPAGKPPMSGTAFVRGRPRFVASVVPGMPPEPIERAVGSSGA
jgi:methionyl-tRNA formyltransferase